MNVNVICLSYLYSAVSLTLVREKRFIRIIYYLFLFFIVVFCWGVCWGFFYVVVCFVVVLFVCLLLFCLFVVFVVLLTTVFPDKPDTRTYERTNAHVSACFD